MLQRLRSKIYMVSTSLAHNVQRASSAHSMPTTTITHDALRRFSTLPIAIDAQIRQRLINKPKIIHLQLSRQLKEAQTIHKMQYNAHIKTDSSFKIGNLIWLSRKHMSPHVPPKSSTAANGSDLTKSLKSEEKVYSPSKPELLPHMKIHPVLYASLLQKYTEQITSQDEISLRLMSKFMNMMNMSLNK